MTEYGGHGFHGPSRILTLCASPAYYSLSLFGKKICSTCFFPLSRIRCPDLWGMCQLLSIDSFQFSHSWRAHCDIRMTTFSSIFIPISPNLLLLWTHHNCPSLQSMIGDTSVAGSSSPTNWIFQRLPSLVYNVIR